MLQKTKLGLASLVSVSALALGGCAPSGASSVESIVEANSITLGVAGAAPSSFLNPDGSIAGVEPEIVEKALNLMGIDNVSGIRVDFSAMIPGLQASQFDIIAGSLFMRQSRCEQVLFSDPIIVSTYSLVTRAGEDSPLLSVKEAIDAGLTIAVISGTVQDDEVDALGLPSDRKLALPDIQSTVDALLAGRVDTVVDINTEIEALGNASRLQIGPAVPDMPISGSGAAFPLGQEALRDAFNAALTKVKENGDFAAISESYGLDPGPAMAATTAQLCANEG